MDEAFLALVVECCLEALVEELGLEVQHVPGVHAETNALQNVVQGNFCILGAAHEGMPLMCASVCL